MRRYPIAFAVVIGLVLTAAQPAAAIDQPSSPTWVQQLFARWQAAVTRLIPRESPAGLKMFTNPDSNGRKYGPAPDPNGLAPMSDPDGLRTSTYSVFGGAVGKMYPVAEPSGLRIELRDEASFLSTDGSKKQFPALDPDGRKHFPAVDPNGLTTRPRKACGASLDDC